MEQPYAAFYRSISQRARWAAGSPGWTAAPDAWLPAEFHAACTPGQQEFLRDWTLPYVEILSPADSSQPLGCFMGREGILWNIGEFPFLASRLLPLLQCITADLIAVRCGDPSGSLFYIDKYLNSNPRWVEADPMEANLGDLCDRLAWLQATNKPYLGHVDECPDDWLRDRAEQKLLLA